MRLLGSLIFGCAGLVLPALQAGVIYTNGTLNTAVGNEMTQWIQTENFSFAADTTVTDVHFDTLQDIELGNYSGSITYFIYADDSGSPGTQLVTGSVDVAETLVGPADLTNFNVYSLGFVLDDPFVASAGTTYWLGLHNGPIDNDTRAEVYWATANGGADPAGFETDLIFGEGTFTPNGNEHFFELTDDGVTTSPTPEPASMLTMGIGLVSLGFAAKRRRA